MSDRGEIGYNVPMALKYDLHSHTTASDGTLDPGELVHRARRLGVDVLAVTDHDTTEGLSSARAAAEASGLILVPGVEISVSWEGHVVHVLGLNIDVKNRELQKGLARLRRFRAWRAEEIAKRLAKHGIPNALEGASAESSGNLIGRTHFARFLVRKGYFSDHRDVFKHALVVGKPGYVPGQWALLEEAVSWIRSAGGQAVIAHPARYPVTRSKLRRLLGEFSELGGDGMEVVSGTHNKDDVYAMGRHARDFELQASVGSDYHGPDYPWNDIGRLPGIPEGCTPIWEDWTGGVASRQASA